MWAGHEIEYTRHATLVTCYQFILKKGLALEKKSRMEGRKGSIHTTHRAHGGCFGWL